MFGIGDKNNEPPVGAKEKIRRARILWSGQDPDAVDSKREGKGGDEIVISLVIIYGMAGVLALLLTQGLLAKDGAPFTLPDPTLQRWLLGHPVPAFTGSPDTDTLIAVSARGTAIFLCAGIVPLLAKIAWTVARRGDKKPPLALFWAVMAVVLAGAYIVFTTI